MASNEHKVWARRGSARRRWLVTATLLAAAVPAVWRAILEVRDRPVHHFATVEPGVLYRSGQPDEAGWRRLRDHYGIRTVIDLREDTPDEGWAVTEREFCRASGIELLKMPVGPDRLTDKQIARLLAIVGDPARRPVLVHCQYGSSRTGVVVAAYRIAAQGWTVDRALAEADRFKDRMRPGYLACLRDLADRRKFGGLDAGSGSMIGGR